MGGDDGVQWCLAGVMTQTSLFPQTISIECLKTTLVLPALCSLKVTGYPQQRYILYPLDMGYASPPATSADFAYAGGAFRKILELHGSLVTMRSRPSLDLIPNGYWSSCMGTNISSLNSGISWVTSKKHGLQRPQAGGRGLASSSNNSICGTDARWNWKILDWIAL